MSKAWKPPSSRPISWIYFEFRSKLHSLLSFAWTLTRPTNYLRQNIVFSYSEMSFFFLIISLFFVFFLLFFVIFLLLIFTKTMLLLSFYLINFFSWKLLLFFHVPGCSGMLRVPGFIDARWNRGFAVRNSYVQNICLLTIIIFIYITTTPPPQLLPVRLTNISNALS